MSVAYFEKMSVQLPHCLYSLSFVWVYILASVNLTFLWHITSADDIITFEVVKGFGSILSFLLAIFMVLSEIGEGHYLFCGCCLCVSSV